MDLRAGKTNQQLLAIVERGLPPGRRKVHVLVVGAGIAGLVAAYELRRAGHRVTVLEARSRVGGRIYTARDGFADGLAAEVGAMRIPISHKLTMAYVQRFRLKTAAFRSVNPDAYTFIRGQRRRFSAAIDDHFDLRIEERGKNVHSLLERDLAPLVKLIVAEGESGWTQILERWDGASLRDFLVANEWSEGAMEMFGVLSRHESLMNTSFLEFFQGSNDVMTPMVRIVGGMDLLPKSFLPEIQSDLRYGAVVRSLEQGADYVRVHYENGAGRRSVTGDYLIVTLPYAVLRHVDVTPEFDQAKQRAIRQVYYDNASKIFLQFRRKFWEEEGIYFGTTVTDLAIRNVVYPEQDQPTLRGLLLASYTWSQDAHRWAALTERERLTQALDNLGRIHPRSLQHFEAGRSHVWQSDPYAGGAYTVFLPGQQRRLHHDICMPQGRIHFAGEHTGMHRWVEGAVESGLRVTSEVVRAAQHGATLDGQGSVTPWGILPDRLRGRRTFGLGAEAVQSGDVVRLREILDGDPEVVEHHQSSSEPPYDGIYAGATLLHHAVGAPSGVVPRHAPQLVKALLDAGANPDAVCGRGLPNHGVDAEYTALELVVGHTAKTYDIATQLVEILVSGGADLDSRNGRPLHAILTGEAKAGYLDALGGYFRRQGADIDLAFASGLGELDAMRNWLNAETLEPAAYSRYRPEKDRIDAEDRGEVLGEALIFAAQRNQVNALRLLLDSGALPDARSGLYGVTRSALHAASQGDHIEIVDLLLDRGANPHLTDSEWTATPLAWGWVASSPRVVERLRQVGEGVVINDLVYVGTNEEIRDALGGRHPDHAHTMGTPGVLLRNAAFAGRSEVCGLLAGLGADLCLGSALGKLPWEVAQEAGHLALAEELKP